MLDGDFAFVIVDGDDYIAGRDPIGVKPLYYGLDERGRIYFSSEMKSIADQCKSFSTFPPGHYYTAKTGFVKYYRSGIRRSQKSCRSISGFRFDS
jgi:asparagine synthase (glutamine-hydrolysing)